MHRYITVGLTLVAAASFILAWQFVIELEPASPLIPFGLVFLSGFTLRQAID